MGYKNKYPRISFYLLVNTILRIILHLQILCRQLEDQQVAHPTIFISGAKSPLTKALVLLAPLKLIVLQNFFSPAENFYGLANGTGPGD